MTTQQIRIIDSEIQKQGLKNFIEWVKQIASLVQYKSGMFGIPFKKLIPYLEAKNV